ncbi:Lactoylglutathione lyase [Liberibacter crescens BT-1]|uniref:Lactoylglutathione lyase n=2 Tax=Liberibacter crescens TaxID=1273132 RepID=L0ESF5_LIBCB|nr:Lactoylglutathione lyase [Liberibacter crescens BT-1]
MVRVKDLEHSLEFYTKILGLYEVDRLENTKGRYTLVFLAAPEDLEAAHQYRAPCLELTYNWDTEDYTTGRNFGHIAYSVDNIYSTCENFMKNNITINRPPRDGKMAFILSPDKVSIEILQKNNPLEPKEPWLSMPNIGTW